VSVLYYRVWSHRSEDEPRSLRDDPVRSSWHSSHVPLPVDDWQLPRSLLPHLLQEDLLRHLLLPEVRADEASPAADAAQTETTARPVFQSIGYTTDDSGAVDIGVEQAISG